MPRSVLYYATILIAALASSTYGTLCRLELQLDDKPDDTTWEVRGPIPAMDIVDGVAFGGYDIPHQHVIERFDLEEGQSYYFMISDYEGNGIEPTEEGATPIKLVAELEHPIGDVILAKEENGSSIEAAKAFMFTVPMQPQAVAAHRDVVS
eukprot:CAMPEP_0194046600 /NCGR_PEP_ID=MMETSP0009_2-20130614/21842_1 /TAXON_ID=210454 /ORGANISM="Grammatophora oceanica, Strain CCMP 410" /LENGTH=150 /DNA_ID=CAMNT_0038691965 /DNA_START=86 /DNA_END=538 /DNA_ORIENTATION=+